MIHCFTKGDHHFVLDVYSGSVHAVDALTLELIKEYEAKGAQIDAEPLIQKYGSEAYQEAREELDKLIKEELLFTEDANKGFVFKPAENQTIKALCLHVAHDCNLKCRYCFAAQGNFQGERALMSKEVAKAALDMLIAHSGNRHNLEVDLFGGEPLMNKPLLKWIVEYRDELEKKHNKLIRLTVTTNGILLDEETQDFINEHFFNCVLSIDGRREVNDHMRPCLNDKGSYDVIVPKFKAFVEKRLALNDPMHMSYYIRGTFTNQNLDFHKDVLHLADLGFHEISVEPVVSDKGDPYRLDEADLPKILASYDELAEEMVKREKEGKSFNFFHYNIDFDGGPCFIKKVKGCGAGTEYFAITPEGDMYPCHRFVGNEAFKLGNVLAIGEKLPFRQDFFDNNVLTKEACSECWAKYYCSGGCHANQYTYHGDFSKPYALECEMQKKRIENAIYLKYMNMNEEECL